MKRPLISITVPVYNAEKYLRDCLDSLLSQTIKDIEIVLVNDGSTDDSELICLEYANKDIRVKYISKENGGSASARQVAQDASNGIYICACDADDWAEQTMFEHLYNKAIETNADVVMCDYFAEYNDGERISKCYGHEIPQNNDIIIVDALNGRFPCSIWNKLIKRDILVNNGITWEPGIDLGEDFLLHLKLLQLPVSIVYLPECLYHYRRVQGGTSYTNKVTIKTYNQMLLIQKWIENHFEKSQYKRGICHHLINVAFAGLRVDTGMNADYYKKTSVERVGFSCIIKEHSLKAFVVLLTKICGYSTGRRLYKMLYFVFYK